MTRRSKLTLVTAIAVLGLVTGCSSGAGSEGSAATSTSASVSVSTTAASSTTTEPISDVRTSAGCGSTPPTLGEPDRLGDVEQEIDVDGTRRTYLLAVPDDVTADDPVGVILNLHGSGSNAAQQAVYSRLPVDAPDRGYIVVTPDAIDGKWQMAGRGTDDDFLMAVLDRIEADYCVDLDHVHTTGISLGSWKATIVACHHPDRIASMALVAEEVAPPDCAKSVVAFHGTADSAVPYGEGADEGVVVTGSNARLSGVEVNMPAWATQAGCSDQKDVERIEPDIEHWIFQDCPEGMGVEFYSIEGGGHTWPGAAVEIGATTETIDATEIALDWFDAHPLVEP
ncbi:MAG: hypothetical protein KF906_03285 [Actinobacteria bacterium]|nr:hypothetical protein [Actinomycetota bacterium]